MKNPLKINAFKNLMAHTCAATLTATPSILTAAAIFATSELSGSESTKNMLFVLSLVVGVVGQVITGVEKAFEDTTIFNGLYWKRHMANWEINAQKKDNEKKLFAIRHLITPSTHYQFTASDYQMVASIQLSENLDELSLTRWRESIEEFVELKSPYDNLSKATKIADLYQYINETAAQMDQSRLQEIKNNLLRPQAQLLSEENTFSNLLPASPHIDLGIVKTINQAVYNRARFIQKQNLKVGFNDRDYEEFRKVFDKGYDMVNYTGETITSLLSFLTEFKIVVDWNRVTRAFRDNFKTDTGFFKKTLVILQELEAENQKNFNQNEINQRIQTKLKNIKQSHLDGSQIDPQHDNHDDTTHMPTFEPCDYVYFEGKNLPEKWAELRDNYAIVRDHSDKIEPRDLQDLHDTLNSCLPLLINADQNLSQFPNKNTEQKQKLLSDNLDLAITQVKDVANTLDLGVIKDLKVAMNYQTMKMNAR